MSETIILLARFKDYSDHQLAKHIPYYLRITGPLDLYFEKPLQKIFSKVIAYDFVERMTELGLKAVNEEVIELIREEHPNYVLWISSYYEFRESTFDIIRKEGTTVVGWFSDDEVRFHDYSRWWIPYLDYCVTNDIAAVPKYKALGARVMQAYYTGISVNRDWSKVEEKYAVSFVGRKFLDREQYISELSKRNIPVYVVGADWEGTQYVPFEEMINIFRTSKINLNFSRSGGTPQIKARMFEVCLAGGFLLTEYAPGIEKYFEIDKEIVCFKSVEEMIKKIIYYLNHDDERQAIAQAGWKRASSEYTCLDMLSKVFREIERDMATKGKESKPLISKSKVPRQMRKKFGEYYFNWGLALSVENYKGLWKSALALSIRYYPFDIKALGMYIVGFFPYSVRVPIIKLYRVLLCHKLNLLLYLAKVKQHLTKRAVV